MTQTTEWRIEIDVITVTNDTEGYETPLTAVATTPTYSTKTLRFASTHIEEYQIDTSGFERCVEDVQINTPKLKAGLGVASRNSATITFIDFTGDPDESSPAVTANPDIITKGTYFGKLYARHLLVNNVIRITNATSGYADETYTLLVTNLEQVSSNKWRINARDVLYRLEDEKTTFPKAYSANINTTGTISGILNLNGAATNWDATKHIAVSGTDVMPISSVSGTASTTLVVSRLNSYTIGSRTYENESGDLEQNQSVFRGRYYESATIADIIFDIFEDSGITTDYYNETTLTNIINSWVGTMSIDCVFHEPVPAIDVLDYICQTFLIDIYTDIDNQIQITTTSPFQATTIRFKEGREITYGKGTIKSDDSLRYSRALLNYGQSKATDDQTFKSSSFKFNSQFESQYFYNDEKQFSFQSNPILGISTRNKEIAETTATRFVSRWGFRPLVANVEIKKEARAQVDLGSTVFIEHSALQNATGAAEKEKRYQITQLKPLKNGFYNMTAVSYLPYYGTNSGFEYDPNTGLITAIAAITVYDNLDINLYTEVGSPEPAAQLSEYTFILDADIIGETLGGQINQNASIVIGEGWASTGITFNIVCLNGIVLTSIGGNGGAGGLNFKNGNNGQAGGTVIRNTSGQRVNVFLAGSRTVQSVVYNCNGYLYAPGGGGGGGGGGNNRREFGGNGAGGAGYPAGEAGNRRINEILNELTGTTDATNITGGDGENLSTSGGDGGDSGNAGGAGGNGASTTGGTGGSAGKAIVLNSGTVYLYGNGRFQQGSGDSPTSIIA